MTCACGSSGHRERNDLGLHIHRAHRVRLNVAMLIARRIESGHPLSDEDYRYLGIDPPTQRTEVVQTRTLPTDDDLDRVIAELGTSSTFAGLRAALPPPSRDVPGRDTGFYFLAVKAFKRRLLQTVLDRHRGNRTLAARELGISRESLYAAMKEVDAPALAQRHDTGGR